MKIRFGYELVYTCSQPVPMILMLHSHQSRSADLLHPDRMITEPEVPLDIYADAFGNTCTRIVAPAGGIRITADALDPRYRTARSRRAHTPRSIPSRCCRTMHSCFSWAAATARRSGSWTRRGAGSAISRPAGRGCRRYATFAHRHIAFGYHFARPTKTASEAYAERQGVCRDYAHLAITLLRCLNIPARYCTGYLGDIGVPLPDAPMDFSGWLEAYIGGAWHTFDPRNNQRRIGRILIARGRDAADVAISTAFGPNLLQVFRVWTDEA